MLEGVQVFDDEEFIQETVNRPKYFVNLKNNAQYIYFYMACYSLADS